MVAGEVLVRDNEVLATDEGAVRVEAQSQLEALAQRVVADAVHKDIALLDAMEAGLL
jgi:hypothetical protein